MSWCLTRNYPMKHLLLLANIAMITVRKFFIYFHSSSCQGNIFLQQNGATYLSKISLRKWSQTDKDHWRKFVTKLYLASIAKDKDPSIRVKMHQHSFFNFYHHLSNICWVDVIYLTRLVFLKPPWWLVWI